MLLLDILGCSRNTFLYVDILNIHFMRSGRRHLNFNIHTNACYIGKAGEQLIPRSGVAGLSMIEHPSRNSFDLTLNFVPC